MITTYDPASVRVTIGGKTYSDGTEWWADDPSVGTLWRDLLTYRPRNHGRWVAVYVGDDGVRGLRFSSLSRARRYARSVGGCVRRYRAEDWMPAPPEPSWNVTFEAVREGDGTAEALMQMMCEHRA